MTLSTLASRNPAEADCKDADPLWELISPDFLREMGWSA